MVLFIRVQPKLIVLIPFRMSLKVNGGWPIPELGVLDYPEIDLSICGEIGKPSRFRIYRESLRVRISPDGRIIRTI